MNQDNTFDKIKSIKMIDKLDKTWKVKPNKRIRRTRKID